MSQTCAIADALVAELNALSQDQTVSQTFTAARIDRPLKDLQELGTLAVVVIPATRKRRPVTRSSFTIVYRIDCAVQYKFATGAPLVIDPYLQLAEELGDALLKRRLTTEPSAICLDVDHPFLFVPDHLEKRLFTSVIAYTLQVGP